MGKDFLSLTTPSTSTKHYFSRKPLARPTCAVRTTTATGPKFNKRVAIQILYFIGLYVMCQHSIHPGCVKHLNDFQKLASRLTFALHARSEVRKARPTCFISARRIIEFYPQKLREWTNVLVNVSYLSYTCHNTCPKVASYAEALWACHAMTVYAYLCRKLL